MYLLKLFHESDPVQPVGAYMVGEGTAQVGRDPASDWVIPDADCEISRNHLEFSFRDGALTMRSLGANGVFRAEDDERVPDGEDVPLALGDRLRLGKYMILVDPVPFAAAPANTNRTMILAAPFGEETEVPSDWADAAAEPPPLTGDGSLLEAFCEGAKLDASAFSADDPAEVMRRAGAVYRQMVLGLGDLMSARSSTKTHYRMDRTTIAAQDNNPFKWAPTQRLAIDLLMQQDHGFLSGAEAVKSSFEDLKKHLLSTLAGFRASLQAALELASPNAVAERVRERKGFLKSRASLRWSGYEAVHAELRDQVQKDQDGPLSQAFIQAYEDRMRELDRPETSH